MQEHITASYQKGFNEGYLITEHLPELSDKLAEVKSSAPRIEGFKDGRKQYALDQVRAFHPNWTNLVPSDGKDKDRTKDIDYSY